MTAASCMAARHCHVGGGPKRQGAKHAVRGIPRTADLQLSGPFGQYAHRFDGVNVENANDIERTNESFARLPNCGLVIPPDATTVVHRDLIVELAARHNLPTVFAFRFFVASGGLMSYAINFVDVFVASRRCCGPGFLVRSM